MNQSITNDLRERNRRIIQAAKAKSALVCQAWASAREGIPGGAHLQRHWRAGPLSHHVAGDLPEALSR
ncbi:hypothetical protein [Acutalibacter sp. 1XD8-33]|uniref:hypothetical protein n=1 Tax=Acutalibacter sp. 1XD8-33 TaxID=2320081 RepID=UPI00131414C3|nr:hypothetical protein [Acutalibacter sp. 1XD8-33]